MTDTTTPAPEAKPKSRMLVVCENIQAMTPKFQAALPAHIPPEKFVRTVLTTIQLNPDIANECEPQSIYNECTKAAADGLIIDGREAALVKYNVKKKINGVDQWVPAAKYMPMVAGLLKKARNSGEIASIVGRCVYQNDKFHVVFGDDEKLTHEPALDNEPGPLRLAYMVAKLKDGTIVRHVMTRQQIEKRKNASRSKDSGPWKSWEDDMWIKTVLRGGMKFLPASTDRGDFADLVTRDDDMYDLDGHNGGPPLDDGAQAGEQQPEQQPRRRGPGRPRQSQGGAGQRLNGTPPNEPEQQPAAQVTDIDPETGEVLTGGPTAQPAQPPAQQPQQRAQEPRPASQPQQQAQPAQTAPAATPAPAAQAQASQQVEPPDMLEIPPHLRRAQPASNGNEPPPPTADDVI